MASIVDRVARRNRSFAGDRRGGRRGFPGRRSQGFGDLASGRAPGSGALAIAGSIAAGGSGTITYTLRGDADGTHLRREFIYTMPNWFAALLDRWFVRRRIQAESAEAVRRLKLAVEAT